MLYTLHVDGENRHIIVPAYLLFKSCRIFFREPDLLIFQGIKNKI